MPIKERYEPLINYKVVKTSNIAAQKATYAEIWKRVNWQVVNDRLRKAVTGPVPDAKPLPWYSMFKTNSKVFKESALFFESQMGER